MRRRPSSQLSQHELFEAGTEKHRGAESGMKATST